MYQSEGLEALTSSSSSLSHWSVSRGYIQNVSIKGRSATYTYVLLLALLIAECLIYVLQAIPLTSRIPMNAPSYQFYFLQKNHQFLLDFCKFLKDHISQNQYSFLQTIDFFMPSLFTLLIRLTFPSSAGKPPINTLLALTYVPAYGIYLTGSPFDIALMAPFTRQMRLMELQGIAISNYARLFIQLIIQQNLFYSIKRELETEVVGMKNKCVMFSSGLSKMEISLQVGEPMVLWLSSTRSTVKIQPRNRGTLALMQEYGLGESLFSHLDYSIQETQFWRRAMRKHPKQSWQ